MTAKQLFKKTMPFVWAKMVLGGITVGVSVILLAILMGIGWLFGDGGLTICLLIWIGATGVVRFVIMHYMGYLVKAGHVAVIAEACKTGVIPANQVAYGKAAVTERFATSNVYFGIDKLITSAVKQIQRGIEKVGNALDFIPGMGAISGLAKFFVSISLGYVDECCLGWTFYQKDQSAYKSAADGVVIYAQNWKTLLKDAAKTMAKVIGLSLVVLLVVFIPVGLLFKILKWSGFAAFLLALLITWVIKFAYLDSYIMVQMMASYMSVAPNTVITFDLYSKLCGLSSSFKDLFNKAKAEGPVEPQPAYAAAGTAAYVPPAGEPAAAKPVFCGQCGAKNDPGTKFCGSCGAPM